MTEPDYKNFSVHHIRQMDLMIKIAQEALTIIAKGDSGCDDEGLVEDKETFPECSDVAQKALNSIYALAHD